MDIRGIPTVRLRPAVIVAGLIMLAFAAGIYSLPLFLTAQLPQWIEAQTGKKASLGGIEPVSYTHLTLPTNREV